MFGDKFGVVDHVKSLGEVNHYCQREVWGNGWLKPWAILCARGMRVETVECLGRKPWWVEERGRKFNSRCSRHTRTLTAGQRKDMRK